MGSSSQSRMFGYLVPLGGVISGGFFFFFGTVTLLGEVSLWPWVLEVVSASESWLAASSQ